MEAIEVGAHTIGPDSPPFIVAEISANHNQSFERALKLIDAAKAAGAHAVKFQTYTPDTITIDIQEGEFFISDPNNLWKGKSLYQLYQEAYTPWEWHETLFKRCKEQNLIAFSTPFDATAVDLLESLGVPCYKIASLEITDLPLIKKAASTGKPLFISTGTATLEEIDEAVTEARSAGCRQLILLKCTSAYPAPANQMNLRTLPHLSDTFHSLVGLSDHTLGIGAAIASIPLGACLIEKHFTLARSDGGVDSAFSLEPAEFAELVCETKRAWEAIGSVHYGPTAAEKTLRSLRRSLYFVKDIKAGDKITEEHIRAIRPGNGLPPKEYSRLIGRYVNSDIKRGEATHWDQLRPL